MFLITVVRVHCLDMSGHVLDHFSALSASFLLTVISSEVLLVAGGVVKHLGAKVANKRLFRMMIHPVVVES